MLRKKLFETSLGKLVKAYHNGTLEHGSPCGCAVGNLIFNHKDRRAMNLAKRGLNGSRWYNALGVIRNSLCHVDEYTIEIADELVKETGYTWDEINLIETAFESVLLHPRYNYGDEDEDGFQGLMAVVDVLQIIHKFDDDLSSEAKKQFIPKLVKP